MTAILEVMKVKYTGIAEPYYFLGKSQYMEALTGVTGIQKATEKENTKPRILIAELLRAGIVKRIHLAYKKGEKMHHASILMATTSPENLLLGKTYNGGTILRAYTKRDKFFRNY
jgi:hypothetical protein